MANVARVIDNNDGGLVIRHEAFPDLTIVIDADKVKKYGGEAGAIKHVQGMFSRGELGPIPEGYSIVEDPKPASSPYLNDYQDWCGLRAD